MSDQAKNLSKTEEQSIDGAVKTVTEIVKKLVKLPDQVRVEANLLGKIATLLLKVSPDDLGVILGNGGRTARSLRTIVTALSVRSSLDIRLEIVVQTNI